jgi:hypothetical protein
MAGRIKSENPTNPHFQLNFEDTNAKVKAGLKRR